MASVVLFLFTSYKFKIQIVMIKSNEIRLGNLVLCENEIIKAGLPVIESLWAQERGLTEHPQYDINFNEVELTEDLILKFGYTKMYGIYFQKYKKRSIIFENDKFRMFVADFDAVDLKSAHHLQNLYFDFYGEELVFSTEP